MTGGEALGWLVKLVAGEKIKGRLNRDSLQKQIRVLSDALAESQDHRKEYVDALERVNRIAADRDHYHGEMMRLRIEVNRQAEEIESLRSQISARKPDNKNPGKRSK